MIANMDKLTSSGCSAENKDKVCRSRGGESCAFDGAMIVLQPIADTAHLVHGPIACCGNTWEGRGTLSSKGNLHRMGFTTDMTELDIVYGSEEKLYNSIVKTCETVRPKAIFVYATCVSGLIGEDIESVCKRAENKLGLRIIPVNAPGFVGPKNLGNRIAGEVLLDSVIGTAEPPFTTVCDINLIGEYNIAGDLWLVEPVLNAAGIRILSRITGNAAFEEITYAHRAKLNVAVCSRALINVARAMEAKYGVPYVEVSFFGSTEMAKAIRLIASKLKFPDAAEAVIANEEAKIRRRLKKFEHLNGKRAVLYTGGVKSWSFISALMDLGIEIVAVGTKKSTVEDEEKMRGLLGENAPLVEDVAPKNLLKLMKERKADMLIAGGRNQYLAIKEGFPFVDVNQERHTAYAGYEGLLNLAQDISNSIGFYDINEGQKAKGKGQKGYSVEQSTDIKPLAFNRSPLAINPLKHSQTIGAAMALQGVDGALPIIHGAQGCTFLAKVLLTKHFREPIALAGTKQFSEDIIMGGDGNIIGVVEGFIEKQKPAVVGVLSSGLSEVKGDDIASAIRNIKSSASEVIPITTPDYEGGLETGYTAVVEALIGLTGRGHRGTQITKGSINVLAGSHLTPADFLELREIIEAFGLHPVILPDLSALDGSRQGFSALATGGTGLDEIKTMGNAEFTLAIGISMESPARRLKERFGIEYKVLESISGLGDTDLLMETLFLLSGSAVPAKHARQRRILIDGMRDAHLYFGGKKVCTALEPDLSVQTSRWLSEMGVEVVLSVIPQAATSEKDIMAEDVITGDLSVLRDGVCGRGKCDLLISNSHAEDTARQCGIPLYQLGFPLYKVFGGNSRTTIGYRGTLSLINDIANIFAGSH
ncbi:MAG: nitrogenase iron-molybdenum cofactor biosynthesis protein NifE [Nitrospirae bacterium]|nr:nitrogenase iron-molybdenum cofactor biosynthesis protein NifE [Nitrospirota bacterium]